MEDEEEVVRHKPVPRCKLALRFLRPTTLYERMVAGIARSPVHVDIVVDKPGTSSKAVCYSAFMREKFSMTLMDQQCMSNPSYENWYVDISEDEADRCLAYLSKLTGKVPYNYSDSLLLIPLVPHNSETMDVIVPDVEAGADPAKLSSVFCSQAAVLMCRECLAVEPGSPKKGSCGAFAQSLSRINSRLVSPADLYDLFRPHSTQISNADLFYDRLKAVSLGMSPFSIEEDDHDGGLGREGRRL